GPRGGLFPPRTTVEASSPFGFAAIAALVGMFIQQSALKLKDVFEALMANKGEQGRDAAPPKPTTPAPVIESVSMTSAQPGADTTITIKGKNFTPDPKVFAGSAALTLTKEATADELTATLPAAQIPKAGSDVQITVQTAAGTSNPMKLMG